MKKQIAFLLVLLLTTILLLSACSKDKTSSESTEISVSTDETKANVSLVRDEDGLYVWSVGDGYTLKTRTNIMDYISNNRVRMNDLARDLGFDDGTQTGVAIGYKRITPERVVTITYDKDNKEDGRYIRNLVATTSDHMSMIVKNNGFEASVFYYFNDSDSIKISFDLIVCYAYAFEHYVDGDILPFRDSSLPTSGQQEFLLHR